MRHSLDRENNLILQLYEAAKDTSLLPSAISTIGKAFRAHVTGMRVYDAANAERNHFSSIGLSPAEWADFDAQSRWCDIWRATAIPDLLKNGVSHSGAFYPWREFSKSTWYNEYAKRIDVAHGMGLCLSEQLADPLATISLNRSHRDGPFQSHELALARRLLPHFRSSYAIMRRIGWLETRYATIGSAIERMRVGFILANAAGKCLYRNGAADASVSNGNGLMLTKDEVLRCTDAGTQQRLRTALQSAMQGRLTMPERIHVRDLSGHLVHVIVVTMIRASFGLGQIEHACAAIFIHAPAPRLASSESQLRLAFGLTAAEARLAALLANGDELSLCARTLELSLSTVRTQLRSVFAKTGTNRQATLQAALLFALSIA